MRILGAFLGALAGILLALLLDPDLLTLLFLTGAVLGAVFVHRRVPPAATFVPPVPERRRIPPPPVHTSSSPPGAEAFTESFLDTALRDHVIDRATHDALVAALVARTKVGAGAPATTVPPRPPSSIARVPSGPERPSRPEPRYAPMPERRVPASEPPAPSPVAAWFARVREAVVSDVAVHGLAYLGVFLVFAGTLGFFLFSFGSLSLAARPWAELAIPTVLLASAWFLRRRGAPVVATALGVVGGVLLPVVLLASYVDGVAFPPEFSGDALAWAAIVTCLALAGVYAASPLVVSDSSVRYLAAPLVWTALWSAGLLLPDATGEPLTEWTAGQFALVAIGVAATAVLVALRPDPRLSREARPTLVPGAIVALGVGLLLAAGQDWPWWVLVVLGLASLVSVEAIADRLGDTLARILPAPLLWLAAAGVLQGFDEQVAGPALVVASLALLEWQSARGHGGPIPIGLHAVGVLAGLALAVSVADPFPWAPVAALVPLVAWSHLRRVRPLPGVTPEDQAGPVAAVAAVSPLALAVAFVGAVPDDVAFLVLAFALWPVAAVAYVRASDPFLAWWVFVAAVVLGAAAAARPELSAGPAAAVVAVATLALVATRVPGIARGWGAVTGAAVSLWFAVEALGGTAPARWGVVVLVAGVATAAAGTRREPALEHAGLAAWIAASVAAVALPLVAPTDPWLVASAVAWTLATWAVTLAFERWDRGPVVPAAAWLDRGEVPGLRHVVPTALSAVGPALVAVAVDAVWPSLDVDVRVILALTALVEAGVTWLVRDRLVVARTIGYVTFVLAAGSAAASVETLDLSVWTLALAIATVAAFAPPARLPFMAWVAWAGTGALAIQLGRFLDVADRDLPVIALAWAGVLALGGLVADDLLQGRRAPGEYLRRPVCLAPASVGLAAFPVATVLCLTGSDVRIAVFALVGAAVGGAVAWLLRLGVVTVWSWALATVAVGVSVPLEPADDPWIAVPWAAALAAVGVLVRPRDPATPVVRRWDLPAFAVGAASLVAALGWAVVIDEVAITWSATGVLVLLVAWALRSPALTTAGRALVVVGALDAGHGWAALVLAIVAVAVALTALRYGEDRVALRVWHQAGAAALAAGAAWELRAWADWSWETLAGLVLAVAGLAVVAALVVRRRDAEGPVIWQLGFLYLAMQGLGFAAASLAWPAREAMVAALLVAAGATAVVGAFWRRLPVTLAAPVLAVGAWLVAIEDLLDGTPMWWAVPAGLVLLVEAAIIRDDRRARGVPVAEPTTSFLEFAGMGTLLVPPLVEIFTWSPARGLIAVGIGLALAVWGVVTKVRRRLFTGVGGVVAAVVLMLVGPITRLVPQIEGPALWGALAVLGLVLVLIATSLERGRARLAGALRRLDEILGSWE